MPAEPTVRIAEAIGGSILLVGGIFLNELADITNASVAESAPLRLCHGWPEHAFSWRHQVPVLVDAGYHFIVPNQRGYGNSSRPTNVTDYDISHLSADLVGILDHYGYDDATFVGHDWGAMVVWWLTLLHPTRVNRVVAPRGRCALPSEHVSSRDEGRGQHDVLR